MAVAASSGWSYVVLILMLPSGSDGPAEELEHPDRTASAAISAGATASRTPGGRSPMVLVVPQTQHLDIRRPPAALTTSRSAGERLRSAARALPTGNGAEGWHSTGAATESSTIIASAKPPVKHMPSAPTPGPPSSSCSSRARLRSQPAIGAVSPVASLVNSRLTQTWRSDARDRERGSSPRSGVPKRCGITTVKPAADDLLGERDDLRASCPGSRGSRSRRGRCPCGTSGTTATRRSGSRQCARRGSTSRGGPSGEYGVDRVGACPTFRCSTPPSNASWAASWRSR